LWLRPSRGAPASYTDGQEVQFQLVGDLAVRSISLPVTFDVTATLTGDTITGVAEAKVKLTDFGITPPNFADTLVVADLFTIRIELTAKEQ
jgi:polyisoprenoid-binding protein YceI